MTTPSSTGAASEPKAPVVPTAPSVVDPKAVSQALEDYKKIHKNLKKGFKGGAAALFTDEVTFPADLTDAGNPANDVSYLHLLTAVLQLKQLKQFFSTPEQAEELEQLEQELREEIAKEKS